MIARLLGLLPVVKPAPAPMTYAEARAAYMSARASGDEAMAREALRRMVDAQSVTAGVACVSQTQ